MNWKTSLGQFRIIALVEGISFLILLGIAMPLKYALDLPMAVSVIGMIHGVLFVLFVIWLLLNVFQFNWDLKHAVVGFLAGFVPFGTFWADKNIYQKYVTVEDI